MKLSFKLIIFGLLFFSFLSAETEVPLANTTIGMEDNSALSSSKEVPIKYFLKSAIIPGWGELSSGSKTGYFFLSLEAILWFSKYYVNNEKDLSERKAFNYAVQYAHIDPSIDHDEDYYGYLKKYSSSGFDPGGYNSKVVETAILLYPNDAEMQEDYLEANAISDADGWNWDSYDDRAYYAGRRTDILDFADMSKAIGGAILANHFISGINSLRNSAKRNRLQTQVTLDSKLNPVLNISYSF